MTPLVLLHGWGLSASVWAPLRAAITTTRPLIAPDLPGHGNAPAAGDSLESWADALAATIPEGSALVGWSLGALLALDIARRHPDKVSRLILTGASPCFTQAEDWPDGMPAATLDEFRLGFDANPDTTLRRFVALQALGDSARRTVSAALTAALSPADPGRQPALATGLRLLADTDLRSGVASIRQPVRLIHGARDTLMPVAASEWLADTLPDARLSIFGDAGHAPFISRPAEFAALLEAFLLD